MFNWKKGCGYDLLLAINSTNQYNFSPSVRTNEDCSTLRISSGNYLQNENEFDKVFFSCLNHIKTISKFLLKEVENVGLTN